MKNFNNILFCYKYSSNIENLISKLTVGPYYKEYLIEYHNENSFSIGVERLGHSSGRWYEATIEKIDNSYLIKGKLVVFPKNKREIKKEPLLNKVKIVLIGLLFLPLLIIFGVALLVSHISSLIKRKPSVIDDPEKKLDYFMIDYLGCEKNEDLILFSDPEEIEFEDFKEKIIEVYGYDIPKKKLKKHVLAKNNYIWHLFSFELIDKDKYLIGEDAKKAYDSCDKTNAIVFYELPNNHFMEITHDFMTSEQISHSGELYVFANDLSWIYFGTHEESIGLGPYFIKKR